MTLSLALQGAVVVNVESLSAIVIWCASLKMLVTSSLDIGAAMHVFMSDFCKLPKSMKNGPKIPFETFHEIVSLPLSIQCITTLIKVIIKNRSLILSSK